MRILVMDDESAVRDVIGSMLAKSGAEVDTASTCAEAFSLLDEGRYDWVILDHCLPDGDGLDVLKKVGVLQPDARAIMITGDADVEQLCEEALTLGAEGVLAKPFCLQELLDRLRVTPRAGRAPTSPGQ